MLQFGPMFIRDIKNRSEVEALLRRVGVTEEGVAYMGGKGVFRVICLGEIDTRGANILKQEALACDAEVALPRSAAGFSSEKVDAVLMATDKQILRLVGKLKVQPFGLKKVASELLQVLVGYDCGIFSLKSPHGRELNLDRAVVMGVLNVAPDSFWSTFFTPVANRQGRSEHSQKLDLDVVVSGAKQMVQEGAVIIDVGGESSGPGSVDVSLEEELERTIPVVKAVRKELPDVFISIDTWKFEVARAAIEAGADMINDVTAGRGDERMLEMDVPIVLMYSKDASARTTADKVEYKDVMRTVVEFLQERVSYAQSMQIIVDPGMGAFVSGEPKYSFEILK